MPYSIPNAIQYAYENYYGLKFGKTRFTGNLKPSNRISHGILHAMACMQLIPTVNNLYKKYITNYEEIFNSIAKQLIINTEDLLSLLQIAALFHDSGRQGDGKDLWDADSAENCYRYLTKKLKVREDVAKLIANTVEFKDDATKFKHASSILYPNLLLTNSDYLRQLVNMADTIEVIRCRRIFDCKYLPILQINIKLNSNENFKQEIINLLKNQVKKIQAQNRLPFWHRLPFMQQIIKFTGESIPLETNNDSQLQALSYDTVFINSVTTFSIEQQSTKSTVDKDESEKLLFNTSKNDYSAYISFADTGVTLGILATAGCIAVFVFIPGVNLIILGSVAIGAVAVTGVSTVVSAIYNNKHGDVKSIEYEEPITSPAI